MSHSGAKDFEPHSGPVREAVASDVMTTSLRTCSRFSRVIEAVLIFKEEDCGLVPVVEEGKPLGVVTDRDIALALADHENLADLPLEEIMTTTLVTVPPSMPLTEVIKTFSREDIRRLLVVDEAGILVGIIGWKDVCGDMTPGAIGRTVADVLESPSQS